MRKAGCSRETSDDERDTLFRMLQVALFATLLAIVSVCAVLIR